MRLGRILGIFSLLFSLSLFPGFPVYAAGGSWLSGYGYRKQITIDHTKVSSADAANFTNFPVLVSLSGLSNIKDNGADIRFTTDDGATELSREIESYSSGNLVAWVNIPNLDYTADTIIYIYYGNAGATEPAVASTYGSQKVWINDFSGVWHLKENGNGAVGDYQDSTSKGNNSTNTIGQPAVSASGKIGNAQSFSAASSNFISVGADSSLNPAQFTISFWVDTETTTSNKWNSFVSKEKWNSVSGGWLFYREITSKDQIIFTRGGFDTPPDTTTTTAPTNGWHRIVGTYNGTTLQFWLDGNSVGQKVTAIGDASTIPLYFGSRHGNDGTGNNDYGTVVLDEITFASSVRTNGWIATEYNNQNSPSTFYTTGDEEIAPTPTPTVSSSVSTTISSTTVLSASAPVCNDSKPVGVPDLFQINTTLTSATIYFSPINRIANYYISYATNPSAQEHGVEVHGGDDGVQQYTIYFLKPNDDYFFKVRGQNGCMPGDWSSVLRTTTDNFIYYRYYVNNQHSVIQPLDEIVLPTSAPTPTMKQDNFQKNIQQKKFCFLWWCW